MSIKRFNPTCAALRVWYIMSPVGTRGLTWALGGERVLEWLKPRTHPTSCDPFPDTQDRTMSTPLRT